MAQLSSIVASVRDTIQDEDATSYRVPDAKMVRFANDFVRDLALLRPDLFSTIGEITCVANTCLQTAPSAAFVLMDIFQVKNGRAVYECRRTELEAFNKNWQNDAAGEARHWIRHDKDPLRFFLYPKAPVGQILIGQWAALPAAMTSVNDEIPLQVKEIYYPAMHHYMVFRAEAKDDEHVLSNRARLFYEAFVSLVGMGKATKREAEYKDKVNADSPAQ